MTWKSAPAVAADLHRKAAALPTAAHNAVILVCAGERVTHLPEEARAVTAHDILR